MRKSQPLEFFKNIPHEEDNSFVSRLGGTATISSENNEKNSPTGELRSGPEKMPANPFSRNGALNENKRKSTMDTNEVYENLRQHLGENNSFLARRGESAATPRIGGKGRTEAKVLNYAADTTELTPGSATRRRKGERWETAKEEIHNKILNQLDFDALKGLSEEELSDRLRLTLQDFVQENIPLEFSESPNQMVNELLHELVGLGPLEPLLDDDEISEIMIIGHDRAYVEKSGNLYLTDVKFRDESHLRRIIDRIVSRMGRRVDESTPMVDARLQDGSRVNAIIPPLALDGSMLTIRRFSASPLGPERLIEMGALTEDMAIFLKAAVQGALNIIVSGGTGSGKTTFLNMLSSFIPSSDRIITIEDSAELQLQQEHVARMETRMANVEGKGEVVIRDLLKNALRMRPDRIVVGECRGGEAFDMLQAMNTGHDGSLTTLHANSPRDAVSRLSSMILMAGMDLPEKVTRQQIASAVDIIVQLERMPDGTRKVTRIAEISGMEGETVAMQDIFAFEGKIENGKVLGKHKASGVRPKCADKLILLDQQLPDFGSIQETEKINAA